MKVYRCDFSTQEAYHGGFAVVLAESENEAINLVKESYARYTFTDFALIEVTERGVVASDVGECC